MKIHIPCLAFSLLFFNASGQVPNAGFEQWNNPTSPTDWSSNSSPPSYSPVTQSGDPHSGSYAVRCEVLNYQGTTIPPYLYNSGSSGLGFPISQTYTHFTGWVKSSMVASDAGYVEITVYDSSSSLIGYGIGFLPVSANYTQFSVPISYTGGTAATAVLSFSIIDTLGSSSSPGSYFLMDDIDFTITSNIAHTSVISHFSVFPNPAGDYLNISGNYEKGDLLELSICDYSGRDILNRNVISSGFNFPPVEIHDLRNGIYFLTVKDSRKKVSRRIIVNR